MNARPTELTQIGPYRIRRQIGEGGMGVVYLGTAPDGRPVAVKTLRPWLVGGTDGRRRFEREVSTLVRVRGSRVAEVLDADVAADPPYVVTRYVDGVPLTRMVAEHEPLSGADLQQVAVGLLEALASVHAAGVVHRDVKPGNVLVTADGPVLIDFGIAHAADDTRLTATGFISGTPGYLAPETVIGQDPTPATDVHGWAATVTYAATGRPPYGYGPDIAVLDRIRRGEHDLHGVEPGLAAVLGAALQVDPARRPGVDTALRMLAGPDAADTTDMPPVGAAAPLVDPSLATTDETAVVTPADLRDAATATAFPPAPSSAPTPSPRPAPAPPQPPAPAPHRDPGVWRSRTALALAGLVLALVAAWAPYAGAVVALGVLLLGRVTWRIRRRLFERRELRGQHRGDPFVAALALPWDLLASVAPCVGQVLVAAAGAVAVGGLLGLGDVGGLRTPYLVGGVVGALLVWWGPGTVRSRHGLTAVFAPMDRAPRTAWAVLGVLALAVCGVILTWESLGTVWWPADGPPGFAEGWFS
ncbi:serine/threonine-protein kinase [Jiangella asiatica]|uniref:Serine/threonine protein kinase n=1 Tax=Jiangella asiatica TaxID=2530372 RepID=A0A4R5CM97_9ACTN|nr:serine/threonine-protein kinase [Jiangella asiatica]TDE01469.1 serine/threonine protein kinase [Jiangella asiatica]